MPAGAASPRQGAIAAPLAATALAAALLAPAPAQGPAPAAQQGETAAFGLASAPIRLKVRAATDLAAFGPLLEAFVAEHPEFRVDFEIWITNDLFEAAAAECRDGGGDTDLLISSAVHQLARLVNDGCAMPHRSLATAALPTEANWRDELFGVTSEPAVIVYNRDLTPPALAPRSRFDLIDALRQPDSVFAGRVATYDIEASGVGYLFAFADSQQASTFGSLIEAFARSGAVATCCSAEIIDGVAEGRYLVAYNVLGSYAQARAEHDPRLAVVAPEDYTLVLRRGVTIPRDAPNPAAAGLLIDFMLSPPGRAALRATRLLPDGDASAGGDEDEGAQRTIALSPVLLLGLDQQKRAQFLARWRATFARP